MVRTVAEIAAFVGGTVEGDGERRLDGVRGLADASPSHLSFLSNRRYVRELQSTQAGAVLVGRRDEDFGHTVIRCADPYVAFARALTLFFPIERPLPGIHPLAVVEGNADGATVMAFAYVGRGAVVGAGSVLYPGSFVGEGAVVGRDVTLMAGAVVCAGCEVGDRSWLNPGAVVGGEGFGFARAAEGWVKIPQVGRAVLGEDVELGSNTTVDRGALSDTRLERGVKLDNLVQIGHGATVGEHSLMVATVAVGGSTAVGRNVTLAARATVLGHLDVGDGATVAAQGMLTHDLAPGERVSGVPAIPHARWLEVSAALPELPRLRQELAQLREDVAALKARIGEKERS